MWRFLIVLCFVVLSGCKTDLYRNLTEREANEMLAVLVSNGISASKEYLGDEGVTLTVEEADLSRAIDALSQNGLPRENRDTIGTIFEKSGVMSSPFEERVRFVYALGEEVSRTLSEIDGVLTARVHIVLPDEPELGQEFKPSSAAVFIKHRIGVDLDFATPQIRRLVSSAIEGVTYEDVTVLLVEAEKPNIAVSDNRISVVEVMPGLAIRESDINYFWRLLIIAGGVLGLLAIGNIVTYVGFLRARKEKRAAVSSLEEQAMVAE